MSAPTLTERLRLHAHHVRGLSYNGIPGTVIPVGGILAEEAAATITTLERQLATAREALRDLLRGEYESAEPGLCDCVDNHGKPYQSQFLADRIAKAEAALTPGVSDAE